MIKIAPATPDDPLAMIKWFQLVRDTLENNPSTDLAKKSSRGRTEKTAAYTLVTTDGGKTIFLTGSVAKTFTLDAKNHITGDQGIIMQQGSGQITIAAATGTNLRFPASFSAKTKEQWSQIAWEKISTTEISLIGHLAAA